MEVREYVNDCKGTWPKRGVKPVESGWMYFGDITIKSGSVWFGDLEMMESSEGVVVKIANGKGLVEAKGMDFKGHRRLSRLRVVVVGKGAVRKGKKVGEVIIDSAYLLACDLVGMERNYSKKEKAGAVHRLLLKGPKQNVEYSHYNIELDDKSVHMCAYTTSGMGDGVYPVFEVMRGGKVVGAEVVFMGKELPGWQRQLNITKIGVLRGEDDD